MSIKPTRADFMATFENAFADPFSFTREDWEDIAAVMRSVTEANCFDGDPMKDAVCSFILFFEQLGYLEDDRIPLEGRH